jgi:hypothetical protein
MRSLKVRDGAGTAQTEFGAWTTRQPVIPGFVGPFTDIDYADGAGSLTDTFGVRALSDEEVAALEAWLSDNDPNANRAQVMHAVDAEGRYLGLVPVGEEGATRVMKAPRTPGLRYVEGAWVRDRGIETIRTEALQIIDAHAGKTRTVFITSTPGQEGTYLTKAAQAEAYRAGARPAGGYVVAEAEAMGTSIEEAVALILATRDLWEGIGPQIEKVRRRQKIIVDNASTVEAIEEAVAHADAAFGAIASLGQ